ncbi:fungal-specific transcription factor domain-containing protein [Lipomyces kononenkoae]
MGASSKTAKRSSIACKRCHASKIRCDVSINGSPCTRCRERNFTDCQLIESRRGLYDRKAWMRKMKGMRPVSESESEIAANLASTATGGAQNVILGYAPSSTSSQSPEEPVPNSGQYSYIATSLRRKSASHDKRSSEEWSVVFKLYGNDTNDVIDSNCISYFGESFPMSVLLKGLGHCRGMSRQSVRPISSTTLTIPGDHPDHITPEKIQYLESQKCFTKPQPDVLEQFFTLFFHRVHPLYAIIDRVAFMKMYKDDNVPWLLLHSICFAVATYCPTSLLCRENASTRRDARMKFYSRAKTLFDFSYETSKLALLQSAVLLSFWGGQPHDYWNTFSWINIAVNIAETLGIHRSKPSIDISDADKGLWKRIWSCLVTRDSFCAALLGKPLRINLVQCDAEFLTPDDFSSDADPGEEMWGTRRPESGLYVIAMTNLALILRRMVQARATHCVDTAFLIEIRKDLDNWLSALPLALRLNACYSDSPQYIYATAVSLVYNHHLIYMYQMAVQESIIPTSVALEAVAQIADIGSTLVTKSLIAYLPQNAYASFFMAIVMLFTQMSNCAGQLETIKLLQSQLKICEMVVHQAQDHWDHANWILALIDTQRQKLELDTSANSAGSSSISSNASTSSSTTTNTSTTSLSLGTTSNVLFPSMLSNDADLDDFMRSLNMSFLNTAAEPGQRMLGDTDGMFTEMHNTTGNATMVFNPSVDKILLDI